MAITSICFVSMLNPVNDVRTFHKLAKTLGQTNKYQINIIGFEAKNIPKEENINFYVLANQQKSKIRRLFSAFTVFRIWLQVKPKVIVLSSPDLLPVSALFKILFGTVLVYDIRENYYLNSLHRSGRSLLINQLEAWLVRTIERLFSIFIKQFILAEHIYLHQLHFIRNRFVIWENKYLPVCQLESQTSVVSSSTHLIYSGTIAHDYGTHLAVQLFKQLHEFDKSIQLKIIGFTFDKTYLKYLRELIDDHPAIQLIVDDVPQDYCVIDQSLQEADIVLCPYLANPSFLGKFPSKYYEAAALQKPLLIHQEAPSFPFNESLHGLRINFENVDARNVWKGINALKPDANKQSVDEFMWYSYKHEIIRTFDQLCTTIS